jgi:pSer/pThr/pTyr-binding forkhead associated (FHA) protein
MVKACDTVMISEVPKPAYPYLERADGKRYERVVINKNKFIIGRLDGMVDYTIPDNTIGKLHAKIVCREEGCFMKDLNSKNGTYINGSRLTCNEEYEIRDNYRIRFSSYEYIFRQ